MEFYAFCAAHGHGEFINVIVIHFVFIRHMLWLYLDCFLQIMKVLFNEKSYGKTLSAIDKERVGSREVLGLLDHSILVTSGLV